MRVVPWRTVLPVLASRLHPSVTYMDYITSIRFLGALEVIVVFASCCSWEAPLDRHQAGF